MKKAKAAKVEAKTADEKGRPLVGASVSPLDTKRCEALDKVADFLVSDVAHFHNSNLLKVTAKLLPNLSKDFIAGNIGTRRAVRDIIAELPRVDGFRVGIGSGSVCITSEVTRVGAPTLFAVSEVATAVSELNVGRADNRGRRDPRGRRRLPRPGGGGVHGDARLDARGLPTSRPSKLVVKDGRKMKVHRGMASAAARNVRFALDRYSVPAKGLEEGVEAYVAYSGKTADVIAKMENGLKASFGYSGAKSVAGPLERRLLRLRLPAGHHRARSPLSDPKVRVLARVEHDRDNRPEDPRARPSRRRARARGRT